MIQVKINLIFQLVLVPPMSFDLCVCYGRRRGHLATAKRSNLFATLEAELALNELRGEIVCEGRQQVRSILSFGVRMTI